MIAPKPVSPADPPPTVLVVEDEAVIRLAIADYLRDCGWHVLEAGSAEQALAILGAADMTVDVVFSDVQIPGPMDGFGLARWVRAHRPGVRVLLTSGAPAAMARAGDLCREPLLAKPHSDWEVVRRIEALRAPPGRHPGS